MKIKPYHYLLSLVLSHSITLLSQGAKFEWAKSMGAAQWDLARAITLDENGNVYSTGMFQYTADFDPGSGITNLTSNGSTDIYIQKLDPSGNLLWAKQIGGAQNDQGYSLSVDSDGNLIVVGHFRSTVDFDPGPSVNTITSNGVADAFILKLDANGDFLWVKPIGGNGNESSVDVITSTDGSVYCIGQFEGTVDFDPGTGIYQLYSTGSNKSSYLQKLDSDGNFLWARKIGASNTKVNSIALGLNGTIYCTGDYFTPAVEGFVIAYDADGNVLNNKLFDGTGILDMTSIASDHLGQLYVTGDFTQTADFDPSSAVFNLSSISSDDAFVLKLTSTLDLIWVKNLGGNGATQGFGIDVDILGNVFTTGYFSGTTDFDPNFGTALLIAEGSGHDIYIQKLDLNGNFVWAKSMGASSFDTGQDIVVGADGAIYTCGDYVETVDMNPGTGTFNVSSNGARDIFIHKLMSCQNSASTDHIHQCSSLTWIDGITYTSSNNSATWVLESETGCDSIISLDFTIYSNSSIDTIESCVPYEWIDGNTYSSSNNTATWVLTNTYGCDSTIYLNLTIETLDPSILPLDGVTLQAVQDSLSYQWLDCFDNFTIIPGATDQTFIATQNGIYALQVNNGNCYDTSACALINQVNVQNLTSHNDLTLVPNPTRDQVQINLSQKMSVIQVQLYDLKGSLVKSLDFSDMEEINFSIANLENGIYQMVITTEGFISSQKLLKQ